MNKNASLYILIATFLMAFSTSCKTSADTIAFVEKEVLSGEYTFRAQSAHPLRGKSINLDGSYFLKVSSDTIQAYLPFYGVAYTASYPSGDGGINFTSTDFEYTLSEKKKGSWNADIQIKDNKKNYKLKLSIGESGYTTVYVSETDRQSISFYGKIEQL